MSGPDWGCAIPTALSNTGNTPAKRGSPALQAGLMYRRYQEAQTNPALAGALDNVRVAPSGDRLKVDAPVSQDQLLSLIATHAFAGSM